MEINEIAAAGYALATAAFGLLCALTLSVWRARPKAGFVALACGATAVWAALQTAGSLAHLNDPMILFVIEWVRNIAWLTALASILRELSERGELEERALRFGALFLIVAAAFAGYYWTRSGDPLPTIAVIAGGIGLSAVNLVLAEQVFRNAPFDVSSSLRYFAVGVAGIFAYDLVIFALTIVENGMDTNQWAARGYITALAAAPLGVAAYRPFRFSLDAHMPRQIVFYFFGLIVIGAVLLVLLVGDYYVREYAGTWGGVARVVLFAGAGLALGSLLVSKTLRARARVFLTKSFFQYKYDYRKEWLRFIGTLSRPAHDSVANTAVRAVAQIVNSPGGAVWIQEEPGKQFEPIGAWGIDVPSGSSIDNGAELVRFLRRRQWVVDLYEMQQHPGRYEGLVLERWITEDDEWWLIVPLLIGERLVGFIMLRRPKVAPALNFEDHDLLRTVGRHAATHIDQAESDKRLAEAGQFGTYNRLTAFLMHDLNNLIAQQSLVVKNAEKFRHNPEFVDDAIDTIANSVTRMRRLMEQLSKSSMPSKKEAVDLGATLEDAAERVRLRTPRPQIRIAERELAVEADTDSLTTIFEHLIRNAQDATPEDGEITVTAGRDGTQAIVTIADTGSGMSPEFIRERLFRPFDSTKGSESMGIGAYQAREYVRGLGGRLDVESAPGGGTTFTMRLPIA